MKAEKLPLTVVKMPLARALSEVIRQKPEWVWGRGDTGLVLTQSLLVGSVRSAYRNTLKRLWRQPPAYVLKLKDRKMLKTLEKDGTVVLAGGRRWDSEPRSGCT